MQIIKKTKNYKFVFNFNNYNFGIEVSQLLIL